jgi:deoxyribonuclease V
MKDIASLDPVLERRLIEDQMQISARVILEDRFTEETIAGVDQAFFGEVVISASAALDRALKLSEKANFALKADFPYIPGFLSFQEGASAMRSVQRLKHRPTHLFVDGCGINHPRAAGLACYFGIALDMPTVGISKRPLCGCFDLPEAAGEATLLKLNGKDVGFALKSKEGCSPIFVAPVHKITLESALQVSADA